MNPVGVSCAACTLSYAGCVAVCGNGGTEPGEACDDGNTTPGDGCDAVCQAEATGCNSPIQIALPLGNTTVVGTTAGPDLTTPVNANGCQDGSGPEAVYAIIPDQNGFLTAHLPAAAAGFDAVLYARADCGDQASQILCNDNYNTSNGNNGGELISFPVQGGVPVYLFVDGWGGGAGAYDLSLDLSIGEDCADPVPITIEGVATIRSLGNTTGFTSDVLCSNGAGLGPDVVYQVTVDADDNYGFASYAGYNSVLNGRSNCTDIVSQLACSNPSGTFDSNFNLALTANQTVFIWVDGTMGEMGEYQLNVTQ